ncbi:MAG: M48 family metalloprotease, partial [Alphaproteobacteria bacterium]
MTETSRAPKALAGLAAALLLGLGLGGCASNPATGEQDVIFMSQADEKRVGDENHPKILKEFGGAYDDPELQSYVTSLGQVLAASSEMPNIKWTFTLLDSHITNAFALPGGYVYVTRGLVSLAESEAQLAAVIGHEIGHVTARHSARRQGQGTLAQ